MPPIHLAVGSWTCSQDELAAVLSLIQVVFPAVNVCHPPGSRLCVADALSLDIPVRHRGMPHSGRQPLLDRVPLAAARAGSDRGSADPLPAVAAGVPGLCVQSPALRRGTDPGADRGGREGGGGRLDVVEPEERLCRSGAAPEAAVRARRTLRTRRAAQAGCGRAGAIGLKLATALLSSLVSAPAAPAGISGRADRAVRVPILVYHHFGAEARDEMTVRTRIFAWQLRYLESHGYRVTRLSEYVRYRLGAARSTPTCCLAWPFGICDAELMSEASRAGYIAAFSTERRSASPADPLLALPRYIVTDGDVGATFARLLDTARPR